MFVGGDGKRQRTRVFTEVQSHYHFEDRFDRAGKGNDKGKVEGHGAAGARIVQTPRTRRGRLAVLGPRHPGSLGLDGGELGRRDSPRRQSRRSQGSRCGQRD